MAKSIYPITDKLRQDIEQLGIFNDVVDDMVTLVGEYEHGMADVREIEGVTLKQYAAVVNDIILYLTTKV